MTHQNFIPRFVKTHLLKYDMTLEKMIQAHIYFMGIFCHFSRNNENSGLFANKGYQRPNFAVNMCIISISNKICLKEAIF